MKIGILVRSVFNLCEYFKCFCNIIEYVLCWIEAHPIFVGVTVPMIVGFFSVREYVKNKRLEACFGFYASLKLQINYLKTLLGERNMLNTKDENAGNIYTLLYDAKILTNICSAFHFPEPEYMCAISECCEKIQSTLMDSKCNINPTSITRCDWDKNLQTIYNFCEFIRTYQKKVSIKIMNEEDAKDANSNFKHIQLCENFNNSLETIVNAINKACEKLS